MEKHSVTYKNKNTTIDFILVRKNIRNVNLRVKADMSVVVSANKNVPLKLILEFVEKKAQWIIKNQEKISNISKKINKPKEYVDGEEFIILGKPLQLKIVELTGSRDERVEINGDNLELHLKDRNNFKRKQKLIELYYKEVINQIFTESVHRIMKKVGLSFIPEVKIRSMISRWGSCMFNKKTITLNSKLIYAPMICIDYVVLHEILHFKNPSHDKKYYQSLSSYMPEWKEYKKLLDGISIRDKK